MTDHATRARAIAERLANWVVTKRPVYFECETVFNKEIAAALDQAKKEGSGELGELRLRLNCPMIAPSCLVCGQQRELVIKHLEAAAIGVCEVCRTAAQAAQPVWSTDKPTYDGPWQWRSSKECGRAVIYIRVLPDPMTGVPRIWQDVPNNGTWIDYGEWAPCPLPREA